MFSFNQLLSTVSRKFFGETKPAIRNQRRSVRLGIEELETRLVPAFAVLPGGVQAIGPVIIPGSPAWFQSHMSDPGVRSLAQSDFTNHGSITRADMLGIFAEVENQGAMTTAELADLRFLVANAGVLNMSDEVHFEANHVVNDAYGTYQNMNVGGLQVGSPASLQFELIDKWLLGMDHPVAAASYSNVAGTLYNAGGPSYLNVHQGNLGDCWLLASLAEAAARQPSLIQNMITYDGTAPEMAMTATQIPYVVSANVWTVRLLTHNGTPCYITVDSELPGGGSYYDHPTVSGVQGNGALWAALVEKAYAQANGDGFVTSQNTYDNAYLDLNGGNPEWALSALIGLNGNYAVSPGNVAAAWNAGSLVVMCTGATTASYDLVPDHCYAVVGYNANAVQPFQLYNPWGANVSNNWAPYQYNGFYVYGLFSTNAAFLAQNFGAVTQTNTAVKADAPMTDKLVEATPDGLGQAEMCEFREVVVSF